MTIPNPLKRVNTTEAFGQPPSTIRALLLLILAGGVLALALWLKRPEAQHAIVLSFSTGIGFYFGQKVGKLQTEVDQNEKPNP